MNTATPPSVDDINRVPPDEEDFCINPPEERKAQRVCSTSGPAAPGAAVADDSSSKEKSPQNNPDAKKEPVWKAVRKWAFRGLVLLCVFGYFWLVFWPRFEGHFTGDAGRIVLDVNFDAAGPQVSISGSGEDATDGSALPAGKDFLSLRFGANLDRGALVFHPLQGRYELQEGCRTVTLAKQTWASGIAQSHPFCALTLAAAMIIGLIYVMLEAKSKVDAVPIYPMWLAYFTALFGSAAILIAAGQAQAFGFDGVPKTPLAQHILDGVDFFLDVVPECGMLFGLLLLLILPQWCAYLFSGVSGAARRSRLIWFTGKWVVLLIAKSFLSASAIVLSIALVGSYYDWIIEEPPRLFAMIDGSLLLLGCGLFLFCIVPSTLSVAKKDGLGLTKIGGAHKWMRRRLRKQEGDVERQLQKEADAQAAAEARMKRSLAARFTGALKSRQESGSSRGAGRRRF